MSQEKRNWDGPVARSDLGGSDLGGVWTRTGAEISTPKDTRAEQEQRNQSQLRVLLVTCAPSNPEVQRRLRVYSASLRLAGHSVLVCIPPGSLSPEHAAEADDAAIEYVFIRQHPGVRSSALGDWTTLLRRFRPDLLHIFPDVPASFALKLVVPAYSKMRPHVPALVETDARLTQLMADMLRSRAQSAEARAWMALCLRQGTQIICPDPHVLQWYSENLHVPFFRLSLVGDRTMPAAIRQSRTELLVAGQWRNAEASEIVLLTQALQPLLVGHASLRIVVPAIIRRRLERSLASLPSYVSNRVIYVKTFPEWLAHLGNAAAVISAGNEEAQREIGAALACNTPVILAAATERSSQVGRLPGVQLAHRDQLPALLEALMRNLELDHLAAQVGDMLSPERPDATVEQISSIYEGVRLRER